MARLAQPNSTMSPDQLLLDSLLIADQDLNALFDPDSLPNLRPSHDRQSSMRLERRGFFCSSIPFQRSDYRELKLKNLFEGLFKLFLPTKETPKTPLATIGGGSRSATQHDLMKIMLRMAGEVPAVGNFGLVQRLNGKRGKKFDTGTENFLFDVWDDTLDNICIVGLSGTIGHLNDCC